MNPHYVTVAALQDAIRSRGGSPASSWPRARLVEEALGCGAVTDLGASELRFESQADAADLAFLEASTPYTGVLRDIGVEREEYFTSDDYLDHKGFRNYSNGAWDPTDADRASARVLMVADWVREKGDVHAAMAAREAPASIRRTAWNLHVEAAARAWIDARGGADESSSSRYAAIKAAQRLAWSPDLSASQDALQAAIEAAAGSGFDRAARRGRAECLVASHPRMRFDLALRPQVMARLPDDGDEREAVDRAVAEVLEVLEATREDDDFVRNACFCHSVTADQLTPQFLVEHSRKGVKDWACRQPGCAYKGSAAGVMDHSVRAHGATSPHDVRASTLPLPRG